jgi:NitT/TauT family transport system substrate-binding protein
MSLGARTLAGIAAATVGALVLAACSSSTTGSTAGASKKLVNVNVGYVAYDDDDALFLAVKNGIFAKHGLNVTLTSQANPIEVVSSMVSGAEQFGFITTPVLANVNSKGTALKCVSTVDGNQPKKTSQDATMLVAAKGSGIKSMAGLRGKKVATVQTTSLNSLSVEVLAKRAGLSPGSYQFVQMPFPQMPAALSQGNVQAAVITSPFVNTAIAQGATVINHPNVVLFGGATVTCMGALSSYISKNRSVVTDFHAAVNEAVAYAKAHQSAAKASLTKYLDLTPAVAQKQILTTDFNPTLNLASITAIESDMVSFGLIKKVIPAGSLVWSQAG